VSTEQQAALDAILRQSAFAVGSDVHEQRRQLRELISAQPLPPEITVTAAALGGVGTAEITVEGIEPRHVVLYFHGGVYAIGDAFQAASLAAQIGRRTRAKVISVDYRLANTRTRQRSTTLSPPTKRSWRAAQRRRISPSRASRPAAAWPSPPWSTLAITVCRCQPPHS
jgi:hypothetical protein